MDNKFEDIIENCSSIIADNIKNPRDVIRFINLFMLKYEKIKDHVDFHDLLILSFIQYNYYSEYRDLYDGHFSSVKYIVEPEITVVVKNKETGTVLKQYKQHDVELLQFSSIEDDELKKIFKERGKREKENFKILLEKLFTNPIGNSTEEEKEYETKIRFKKNFNIYFQEFVAEKDKISEMCHIDKLFDKEIFKASLESAYETNIFEYLEKTNVLNLKDKNDFVDYLQRLLWINKRKVEQTSKIQELILVEDATTAKNLQLKININEKEYKSIILNEFKKIPPLNILANFSNHKEKKIILEEDEILEIIKAEIEISMIEIEGGEFIMDDSESIVDGFKISRFLLTQELYRAVMNENPSRFNGHNLPMETVTWYDAVEFCNKLTEKLNHVLENKKTVCYNIEKDEDGEITKAESIPKATGFRLPTDKEWEYAARGGKSNGNKYSGSNILDEVGWYYENSGNRTHKVGDKQANEFGIYDMSGNVWEWCEDKCEQKGKKIVFTSSGANRVLRGGDWFNKAEFCEVSYRYFFSPDRRQYDIGFRLVLP